MAWSSPVTFSRKPGEKGSLVNLFFLTALFCRALSDSLDFKQSLSAFYGNEREAG